MTGPVLGILLLCSISLLTVRRTWAVLPFITASCYLSLSQAIELGPFTFTAIRMLIAVGVVRVVVRRERLAHGMNGLDWWVIGWCVWACWSGIFQADPGQALVFRLGLAYNAAGIYFLLRIFCTSIDDVIRLSQATAILLLPVGLEMLYEMSGSQSLFFLLEGTALDLNVRAGRVRAVGPFLSPITAGTVGAVCVPLMASIWREKSWMASVGALGCIAMVFTSASSGPILSLLAGVAALGAWRVRYRMRSVLWLALIAYMGLAVVMKAPVYYLMARIDLAGGSTGWHRARVIDSAIEFFGEWWIVGTEYTRHWAPVGGWTPNHTDITSQYVYLGVLGGLPLMLAFIMGMVKAFSLVGGGIRADVDISRKEQFVLWTLGASLFAHAITFFSVWYFDQAFVFFYVTLAGIGSASPRSSVRSSSGRRRSGGHVTAQELGDERAQIPLPEARGREGKETERVRILHLPSRHRTPKLRRLPRRPAVRPRGLDS